MLVVTTTYRTEWALPWPGFGLAMMLEKVIHDVVAAIVTPTYTVGLRSDPPSVAPLMVMTAPPSVGELTGCTLVSCWPFDLAASRHAQSANKTLPTAVALAANLRTPTRHWRLLGA